MLQYYRSPAFACTVLWGLSFLCALMPIEAYDGHFFLLSFVFIALAVMAALFQLSRSGLSVPRAPFLLAAFSFWALALLSVFHSEMPYISLIYFFFFSVMPLSFLSVSLIADKKIFFRHIFIIAAFIYVALSLSSLAQYFIFTDRLLYGRVHLPMADPNSLGGFMLPGFFGAFSFMILAQGKRAKIFYLMLTALIFAALLTTGSRGAFLGLLAGLVVYAAIALPQMKTHGRQLLILAALMLAAFAVLSLLAHEQNSQTPFDILRNSFSGSNLLGERFAIWRAALKIVHEHFWLGTGIGTFFLYYPEMRANDFTTAGLMVHCDPLQFWTDMGVFAPLLFYTLVVLATIRTYKALAVIPTGDPRRIFIAAPFCACLGIILCTHITFYFYTLPILFIMGTMLAWWFTQTEAARPTAPLTIARQGNADLRIIQGCGAALLLCALFLAISLQGAELLVDRAKGLFIAGDVPGFARDINMANRISFGKNARAPALASTIPSGIIAEQGMALPRQEVAKLFIQADRLLDQAIANNPRLASAWHEKAELNANVIKALHKKPGERVEDNGKSAVIEDPRALMETALRYDPLHGNTRVRLAEMMVDAGEKQAALDLLKDGVVWTYPRETFKAYYRLMAKLAVELDDQETTEFTLRRLAEEIPKRPGNSQ